MAWRSLIGLLAKTTLERTGSANTTYSRRLRFESLEDRQMLTIIADTFSSTFAQTSWTTSGNTKEVTYLTVDNLGNSAVWYKPNDKIGYLNPETGDILVMYSFPNTSLASVIDAYVFGNVSDLVGQTYSNGQLIATNGGNTLYHQDGSILRNGNVWTYEAGGSLRTSAGSYSWSNGRSLKNSATYKHPNGVNIRTSSLSIFTATGDTYYNSSTGQLYYPGGTALRDAFGNYLYETSATLESAGLIGYPTNQLMVDSSGHPSNQNGSSASIPFFQYESFANSEVTTTVSTISSATTIAANQLASGSSSAYVTSFHLSYLGDYSRNNIADVADYVLWRKKLGSSSSLPNDITPGVGQDDYNRWRIHFGATSSSGAGADANGENMAGATLNGESNRGVLAAASPIAASAVSSAGASALTQLPETFNAETAGTPTTAKLDPLRLIIAAERNNDTVMNWAPLAPDPRNLNDTPSIASLDAAFGTLAENV